MMKRLRVSMLSFVCLLAVALLAAGCGGGDSTSAGKTTKNPFAGYPKGPTRQFIIPYGDNAVQEFGREATAAERKQVSAVVRAWLRAWVRGEWERACSYLIEKLTGYSVVTGSEVSGKQLESCTQGYAALTRNLGTPPRYNIKGGVASLRVKSGRGFAQYHGTDGEDWIVPVQKEGGRWMISVLYPLARTR